MRVVIAYPTVVDADAVGCDVIEEYLCLKEDGVEAYIYAENHDSTTSHMVDRDCLKFLEDRETILIYHHAIYWEKGLELLKNSLCTRVVKYHNITPEHFLLPYSFELFRTCLLARRQTAEIVDAGVDLGLFDSRFNARDFIASGLSESLCRVLPPFTRIHELDGLRADTRTIERISDGRANVFFAGRVAPNKGHRSILYTAYYYKLLFGPEVRFIMAGGLDPGLKGYYEELKALSRALGVDDVVEFAGRVSPEELKSYYVGSHVFLLLSEHEGFCVPILEAQRFKLPLVAYDSTAVAETLGINQLCFDTLDYETLASSIYTLYNDPSARGYLAEEGYKNFLKYERAVLREKFLSCVGGACGGRGAWGAGGAGGGGGTGGLC